jgi:hypothetical protein
MLDEAGGGLDDVAAYLAIAQVILWAMGCRVQMIVLGKGR